MDLAVLIDGYPCRLSGRGQTPISGVAYNSDRVAPGDVFFCMPGLVHDGHDFLRDAVSRGAVAGVVERELDVDVPQVIVASARAAMAPLAATFYGHPTQDLALAGVTGTNGKTTTVFLLDSILRHAGMKTGLVGTVEYHVGEKVLPVTRTTPEAADLQRLFREMVDEGVTTAAMEVSSHAIDMHRVDECDFDALVFTNLTQDHLDYHHTMEEYARTKKKVFERAGERAHVINIDDDLGREIARDCGARVTYSMRREADLVAVDVVLGATGSSFVMKSADFEMRVRSPLRGHFNVYNSLAAAGAALVLEVDPESIGGGLADVAQVPGRFESVNAGQPFAVLVDYAHTPDSLQQVLRAARRITPGRVIAVFGCGGDRDAAKRPLMGRAAAANSDIAYITSDNPRSEQPRDIIDQIEAGIDDSARATCEVVVDRREAIARALSEAKEGDVVVIAGKGHETGQIFADRTIGFDDRVVAREEIGKIWTR